MCAKWRYVTGDYHQLALHVHRLALFVEFPNDTERRAQNKLNATKTLSRAKCGILLHFSHIDGTIHLRHGSAGTLQTNK
jgi:hypothetical protein